MCSVDNEAVLKSLFKIPEDELTFNRAVEIATEVEESAKVAKATQTRHTGRTGNESFKSCRN